MSDEMNVILTGEQLLNVDADDLPVPSEPGKLLVIGAKKENQVVQVHGLGTGPLVIGVGCMVALQHGTLGWRVAAVLKEPEKALPKILKQVGIVLGAGAIFWAASWAYFYLFVKC